MTMFFASAPCINGQIAEKFLPRCAALIASSAAYYDRAAPFDTADELFPREIHASASSCSLPSGGLLVDPGLLFSVAAKRIEIRPRGHVELKQRCKNWVQFERMK